jgi:hypothetical protein
MHRQEEWTTTIADQPHGGSLTQTFVVRLWKPPEPSWGTAIGLRGVVEHVQSGASVAFSDENVLLGFLRGAGLTADGSTGGAS